MGLECVKVMSSLTTVAVENKSDSEKILTSLGTHFMPQNHLLSIDHFVVRLRQLAE